MSLRDIDSALASNFSLYSSHTVSRGKDFVELCDDDLPSSLPKTASGKSEDLVNPPVSLRSVNFNLPPLHEAAERGDSKAVSRLLADKNVDVNEKAGGHRAQRTALHRAAGYGHLSVVQLLIEAGADPMKCSSVHRTSLHEACTGGHSNVVKYLLQHVTDLDLADLNGQTAAHLAAFHGEADCLRSLESKGSNITLEDKLGRSPAHLAAMKNHPSVLRCILQSNVEINSIDDQGRTPAHYAAIAGGLESLKVLAYNDIDVNSRDVSGCVPAHYAAAHDHCSCLEFLLGSGLTRMDVRDKTGRSLLHLAAQHGAKECVHWLLQKRASPNIRDGSGATPSHLAALGAHLQSLSCLVKHGADLDSQTGRGELPIDFAKRTGNPNSFLKAVSGEVPCKFCVSRQQRIEYDLTHQPTPVEKHIIKQESEIFVTPKEPEDSAPKMPHVRSSRSAAKTVKISSTKNPNLPKRDLATKYFGEHLYSLPVGVIGQETVVRSDKSRRKR